MRKVLKKLLLFIFVFILIINTIMLFDVDASKTSTYVLDNPNGTTQYEINFAQDTYYSGKSEDDAWYQALNENSGQMSEDEIIDEFSVFSRRHLEFDNPEYSNTSSSLVIEGSMAIKTDNSGNNIMSLKNIRVDLCKKDLIGYTYIATTYTDMEGNYTFNYEDIDHIVDFSENNSYNLFIRSYPDSYSFEIARDWIFSFISYYYWDGEVFSVDQNDKKISLGSHTYSHAAGDMAYSAYIMSQALVVAQTFAKDMGMNVEFAYGSKMRIAFNELSNITPFCFYTFSVITEDFYLNYDVIMHEYGHFVQGKLGIYASDLFEIIINDPNHELEDDHFVDKPQKQYAMELTWSESWATVFAQIAQEHYINEYENYSIENLSASEINIKDSNVKISNKISFFGDKYDGIHDGAYDYRYPLENGQYYSYKRKTNIDVINENSCEAQESAVIQFLWDLYDDAQDNYQGRIYDNINWTEEQWWYYTTRNQTQTLNDFTNSLLDNNLYEIINTDLEYIADSSYEHYEILRGIGELLEVHQIAPGELRIDNDSSICKGSTPTFSWKINGSTNNPNNRFKLTFVKTDGTLIYETDYILVEDIYNQIDNLSSVNVYNQRFTYTLSSTIWSNIVNSFDEEIDMFIYVKGYNDNTFISGPYFSAPIHLNYDTEYVQYSSTHHKDLCYTCGDYCLQPHAAKAGGSNRYKPCVACGYMVDTQNTPTFGEIQSIQKRLVTENGSYILDNGIIILVDEDIEKYMNGTLVFYEENNDTDIS